MHDATFEVSNRKEMGQYFDHLMSSTYESLRESKEQEYGENLVKSFILELHNPSRNHEELVKFLEFLAKYNFSVKEIGEENLFLLQKENVSFFLDTFDPRFLLLHSASKAEDSKEHIDQVVKLYPLLDKAWLNTILLEKLSYYGEFESWKTVFNSRIIFKERDINQLPTLDWDEVHLQVKTRDPRNKLAQIKNSKIFENALPITSIRIKKQGEDSGFAREEVSYTGKFTARGNNFIDHLEVVTEFSRTYKNYIETLEKEYQFAFDSKTGLKGEPIIIEYPKIKIENFELLIKNWFNGTKPFLLWGFMDFKGKDYVVIDAIDLHMGHKLYFEIASDFMRIYIPSGSCGNTIARLLTNLEQHFNSSITIYNSKMLDII